MDNVQNFVEKYYEDIIDDIKKVTLVASPPFAEGKRIMYLNEYVKNLGYKATEIDREGNLRVMLKGESSGLQVFSAHVDTVFPEGTKLEIKESKQSIGCPGICDNSTGVVAALYLMRYIKENNIIPKTDVMFLFNVGEEGLGNLRGIRYFFDTIEQERIIAHICIEGHTIGRLTRKVVGSYRSKVMVMGEGGHSWRDFGNTNAIVVAAEMIRRFAAIKLSKEPKTTLNIGTIRGGECVNAIPAQAEFSVEIRSPDPRALASVKKSCDSIVSSMRKDGYKIESEVMGERPCGEMNEKWLVGKIQKVHKLLDIKTIDDVGSTDSNYPISLGLASVTIGVTEGKNTHSVDEYLLKGHIRKGVEQVIHIFNEF
ncbi:MAG: M20/M25/M40 family metallo-hydrolase [archaeon]|nr:M20/M25/M40 family metallo-hydrolase [archaeon]